MNREFEPRNEIKEFLNSRREETILKRPSIYYLEAYADKLLDIANKWKSQSNEMVLPLISIRLALDIFKADLTGELQHDYDKDNKRYRGKWLIQKAKIDSIRDRLITAYEDSKKVEVSK
jgi:hypothetical protein